MAEITTKKKGKITQKISEDNLLEILPETTASQVIEETDKRFFKDSERAKLEKIEEGAQKNIIKEIQLQGVKQEPIGGVVNLNIDTSDKIGIDQKGVPDGVASLDNNGKVPTTQLPDSILGQLTYGGTIAGIYLNSDEVTNAAV
ncbi:hypothetical protein, partial [Mammaliicoccus vitulinus]|uniref:hypothetical protein n=1 Tax=Mammaliicoccus vitulinus TaxID=71237 RepID=UPI00248CDFCF